MRIVKGEWDIAKSAILVVDDEIIYCDVITDILESYGFVTHVAYNAVDALSLLESVTPNPMLLDIMMPEIDGLSLFQHMISELRYVRLWLYPIPGVSVIVYWGKHTSVRIVPVLIETSSFRIYALRSDFF